MLENQFFLGFLAIVIGYVFGCFSTAYFVGRTNHIDIREYGSGNAGTTNAMRTLGKRAGIITYVGDFLKAVIPVSLARFVVLSGQSDVDLLCFVLGLGVVLGHNFPVWLRFKGGKGIAVTSGVFIVVAPHITLIAVLVFVLISIVTKYISLASICAVLFAGIGIILEYEGKTSYTVVISLYILLALWQHRANITRLLHGTENKIGQHKPPIEGDSVERKAEA